MLPFSGEPVSRLADRFQVGFNRDLKLRLA